MGFQQLQDWVMETMAGEATEARMERHRVHNPGGNDFEFNGALMAEASAPRIGTVRIYRTSGGKWVVSQSDDVMRPDTTLKRAAVLDSDAALRDWLGNTREAKQLLEEVGIKVTDWIE